MWLRGWALIPCVLRTFFKDFVSDHVHSVFRRHSSNAHRRFLSFNHVHASLSIPRPPNMRVGPFNNLPSTPGYAIMVWWPRPLPFQITIITPFIYGSIKGPPLIIDGRHLAFLIPLIISHT